MGACIHTGRSNVTIFNFQSIMATQQSQNRKNKKNNKCKISCIDAKWCQRLDDKRYQCQQKVIKFLKKSNLYEIKECPENIEVSTVHETLQISH